MFTNLRTQGVALIAVLMLGSLLSLAATPTAQAAGGPCITKAEFKKIRVGQSPRQVRRIVGSRGRVDSTYQSDGYRSVSRTFKACSPFNKYSYVSVSFDNMNRNYRRVPLNVDGKSAYWLHN